MKNKYSVIFILGLLIATTSLFAQNQGDDVKYRRSSLHLMTIESESFPMKEIVYDAVNSMPFPDKYNNHTIGSSSFNPLDFQLTDEERAAIPELNEEKSKLGASAGNAVQATLTEEEILAKRIKKEMPWIIEKYLTNGKVAHQLVAKWFNMQDDGTFNIDLIKERGLFDASQADVNIAQASARGDAVLKDAGKELIAKTFLVLNKMNYYKNEPVALAIKVAADVAIDANKKMAQPAKDMAKKGNEKLYEKTKDGVTVITNSHLYQLHWNDTVLTLIKKKYFKPLADAKKSYSENSAEYRKVVDSFNDLDFKMKYVGSINVQSVSMLTIKGRTPEDMVTIATVRNVDNTFAKLQKTYEAFKPMTPLKTGGDPGPITAKIGMKEGLKGGEKFVVLEQILDSETGAITYKEKGKVTVDKNAVWDNRYNLGDPAPVAEGEEASTLTATHFKGSKKLFPGMLIKQLK